MSATASPLRAIPGLPEPVARLALGTTNVGPATRDRSFALLDAFVELGGTLVDTAARYGAGDSERVIGEWLRARPEAARRVAVVTKGAHPDPETWRSRMTHRELGEDIEGSLERLGVDRVAGYLVHRDDETLPVGEIVDLLDEQVRAGRATVVGVSNWRLERLAAASAWALANGRAQIALSSEYFALADPVAFPWRDCVSARDDATLAWHAATGVPLLAWSSQAGGYFAAGFDETGSDEIRAAYDSAANRARRARAAALGVARGRARHGQATTHADTAAQVALGWVLSAPSSPIAVAGARSPEGLAAAFEALHAPLTAAERVWIDTGAGEMP